MPEVPPVAPPRLVYVEAAGLIAVAVVLVVSGRTLSGWHHLVKQHPVGLVALSAVTGAVIGHLWLDSSRQ